VKVKHLRQQLQVSRRNSCGSDYAGRRAAHHWTHDQREQPGNAGAQLSSQRIATRFLEAQEEERARVGRELHDGIGQELAILIANLRGTQKLLGLSKELLRRLSELSNQAEEIGKSLREISHDLYPAKLRYLGLPIAAESLCRAYSKAYNIDIQFSSDSDGTKPQGTESLALYRILQEGLKNVAKHSAAKRAQVDLVYHAAGLTLRISDEGCGFDMSDLTFGLGITSIKERAYSIGGSITIRSIRSTGTRIEVKVPQFHQS
jgi:signal transduction histidine kinase